jgi:predicted nucleic-acid-binding Zn-ribbon protein
MVMKKCPKCDNTLISNGKIIRTGGVPSVIFKPDSSGPMLRNFSQVRASVCLNCGYVESFIDEKGLEYIKKIEK